MKRNEAADVAQRLRAGFGKALLGDWQGYRSPGHSARTEAASEILDALGVRVAVMGTHPADSGASRWIFIVLADVIALDETLNRQISDAVDAAAGKSLPSIAGGPFTTEIIVAATHTHTGAPVFTLGEVAALPEARADVVAASVTAATRAIASVTDVLSVEISCAVNRHAVNRRLNRPEGVMMEPDPEGSVDRNVMQLRFTGAAGTIGRICVLPMHPTVLSPTMAVLSGDVAGAISTRLEEVPPAESPLDSVSSEERSAPAALVFQGASGNVRPWITDGEGKFTGGTADDMHHIAEDIATQLLHGAPDREETAFWVMFRRVPVDFPFGPQMERRFVSILAISHAVVLVLLPGEPFVEIAGEIRDASPFDATIVAAHAGATVGYIPTADACRLGGYEVSEAYRFYHFPAPLNPASADRLVRRVAEALQSVHRARFRI